MFFITLYGAKRAHPFLLHATTYRSKHINFNNLQRSNHIQMKMTSSTLNTNDTIPLTLPNVEQSSPSSTTENQISNNPTKKSSQKLLKRWITGLSLGLLCSLWISAGNGIFTLGFLLTSLIAQYEYYSIVSNTGVYPAYKIGIISSLVCFVTAAMYPTYHELVMPLSATLLMIWLLIFNKKSASISEISTSLLGMIYVGYLPSFWVRLRAISELNPSRLHSMAQLIPGLSGDSWTIGATVTWFTWTSIVFADVGAYFVGKKYGKHKLSVFSSAAGSASPNKTIEGAIAGFASCTFLSTIGAFLMGWPLWAFSGPAYGLMISVIALVGDLTASMMKRDAGVKDTGTIFPGHGGLLDRFDSYMFTAPAAFFFIKDVLPFIQKFHKERALLFKALY
eukprot:gene5765-7959_t